MRRIHQNFLLVVAALLGSLFICELGLRLAVMWFPSWSHPVARSWRQSEEYIGLEAYIGMGDWVYGMRYAPGLKNFTQVFSDGVFHVSTSNRFTDVGFRDDRDAGDAPLLLLGDSFSGCYAIVSVDCWNNLLAKDLGGATSADCVGQSPPALTANPSPRRGWL